MALKFSGRRDVYIEIAERYEQYISAGVYRVGDRLPSVRQVACDTGVNPNTVARAYALLEERGVVYSLPKKGVFVKGADTSPIDCREMLCELKSRGVSYDELIRQMKEVFGENDQDN